MLVPGVSLGLNAFIIAVVAVCLPWAVWVRRLSEAARGQEILAFSPAAIEGIDPAIVDTMRFRRGEDSVMGLPEGKALLYGEDSAAVASAADHLLATLRTNGRLIDGRAVPDPRERASLWRVRDGRARGCPPDWLAEVNPGLPGRTPPSLPRICQSTSRTSSPCWPGTGSRASCTATSAPVACTSASPAIAARMPAVPSSSHFPARLRSLIARRRYGPADGSYRAQLRCSPPKGPSGICGN